MRQFREAADRVKKQQQLETLPTEQRIVAQLKAYMQEWKEDLDARPSEAVNTTIGLQVCTWNYPDLCELVSIFPASYSWLMHSAQLRPTLSLSD